jgi:hypothetical protein
MRRVAFGVLCALLLTPLATAQVVVGGGDPITIGRATSSIRIDADLSDEAWKTATRVDKWYETQPGDNIEPKVHNVGYLAYDDRYLYAAFEFDDPSPSTLRAPFAQHDDVSGNSTDYGGILVDGRGAGKTATMFVVTPRNVQYDSIIDDGTGENSSPDFFWDSATRITDRGWIVEMRIPFSSIRYNRASVQTWRLMLYRNYPRDFHYQFWSARIPRNNTCFVCNANVLTGLERLPQGGHLVVAPYTSASGIERADGAGAPLGSASATAHAGLDVKWLPNADNAVDLTVKPDFSQVESDTAQISTNARFALFYPERRPFFLEGADLFSTPIQAVYTRTITAPRLGARATGKEKGVRYTVLVADDAGGGSEILPGPTGSSLAAVDFGSMVAIARARRDVGNAFVSVLATDRENEAGDGHNRVAGPDFQWRHGTSDVVAGQWLFSDTVTPNHPDVSSAWTGQALTGHAAHVQWNHGTTHADWFGQYHDASSGFRADNGFIPQVGYRDVDGYFGWTVRPADSFISRLRSSWAMTRQTDSSGRVIMTDAAPNLSGDTKWNGFFNLGLPDSRFRTNAGDLIRRRQFTYYVQFSPSRVLTSIQAGGNVGQDVDFDNSRPAHGGELDTSLDVRPTQHVELALIENAQWLDVDAAPGARQRLFTARVSRMKGTYTFTDKFSLRVIAQYVSTNRNPSLYREAVDSRSGDFSGSALLSYKLNWQSVMYIGYGDDRSLVDPAAAGPNQPGRRLAPLDRQLFVKVSYAFQR